ncbi:MAG TPA: YncE family protein, partial [Bacteroidia bacterium]|nr:YncE family protein [Bacteroidia bacterium]
FALTFLALNIFAQTNKNLHKVVKKIDVGGEGGWDYLALDEPAQHLFLSHGNVVSVVDLKTDKVLTTIPDTKGVHGIAIANDLNKGFISNGRDTSITVFDLKTLAIIEKVKIKGINPDAILYDGFSHKVFAYNGRSHDATVLDAKTDKVIETIQLGGKPEFSATDEKGTVFVNIEDKNSIVAIDAATLKVKNIWSIAPGEEPTGLAIDTKTHRLFAVCGNKLMIVVNYDNGKVVTTLPIGDGCDGVAYDQAVNLAFSSNGEGTVTVVKQENDNSYKVVETIPTQKRARTITINKTKHQLYLPIAEFGEKPEATVENPKPRAAIKPNTFGVLVIE